MGILDFNSVLTEPGSGESHPFAPPPGWGGDAGAYVVLMRERYRDRMHGQRMLAMARYAAGRKVAVSGPWAAQAREILRRIGTS